MNHTCGGELHRKKIKIRKKIGAFYQNFTVDGFRCDSCGEEIIDRDTALEIDRTIVQLKNLWRAWRIPSDTKETSAVPREQVFVDDNYAVRV